MPEYYIITNSFAAPFFSDTDEYYVCGNNPLDALKQAVDEYSHPCGLYGAHLYASHKAYKSGEKALAKYHSNLALAREMGIRDLSEVKNPKGGKYIVP